VRSWTIVDHHGRRTPSFHPVRRAFAPIRVGIVDGSTPTGGGARVWVRNDTQAAIALELEAGTMSFAGAVDTERTRVEVPARSVREVMDLDAPSGDPYDSAYLAVLRDHETVVTRNRLLPGRFADLSLQPDEVRVKLEASAGGGREAVFESDAFVLGVALDLDGVDDLADNFFDLYPGMPHRMPWTLDVPPAVLFTGNGAGAPTRSIWSREG
jgi:hypothetical protein